MHIEQHVSDEFPFASKFIEIGGSHLHYIDEGEGNPIVFVHGVPTSSYLWRNIIPSFRNSARCIAPDLIGFGLSGKPKIKYSLQDHIEYFDKFMSSLNLENITLVVHGWGSVIGLNYAANNLSKIKAVALYESHLRPKTDWNQLSLPVQQLLNLTKHSNQIEKAILQDNYFFKKIFPMSMLYLSNKKVIQKYLEPFQEAEHRQPLLQYIYDLPVGNAQGVTEKLIVNYCSTLQQSNIPKLLLYSVPGFLTPIESIKWCHDHFENIELVDLGEELHFAQETMPTFFAQNLYNWFSKIN